MLKALFEIWDGAFCRGVIGFELWIVFVRIIHKSSEPTRASEVGAFCRYALSFQSRANFCGDLYLRCFTGV